MGAVYSGVGIKEEEVLKWGGNSTQRLGGYTGNGEEHMTWQI